MMDETPTEETLTQGNQTEAKKPHRWLVPAVVAAVAVAVATGAAVLMLLLPGFGEKNAEEELLSLEEAKELFATYRDDMEAVNAECKEKFAWICIDQIGDGHLKGELELKGGTIDSSVKIDEKNLSKYTTKADLIISLFKELQAARISYTQEIPDRGAIMSFDLKHTSVPNGNTGSRLPARCGIVCSTERYGEYVDLDGDWFYYISIMG